MRGGARLSAAAANLARARRPGGPQSSRLWPGGASGERALATSGGDTAGADADAIVIGGGVVGLAIGARLARSGLDVLVLEKNDEVGQETSSRSSEVAHAGLYYAPGSLKARACVTGNEALRRYCALRGVQTAWPGKLVAASGKAQEAELRALLARATLCGARDLRWVDSAELGELEPSLAASAAILSPRTGVVDSHGVVESLRAEIEARGGAVACGATVVGGDAGGALPWVEVESREGGASGAGETTKLRVSARSLILSAGLWAPEVADRLLRCPRPPPRTRRFALGRYFADPALSPFRHLIYPLPDRDRGGLGVHLTLDLAGAARYGPDTCWLDAGVGAGGIRYDVPPDLRGAFEDSVRRFHPTLREGSLSPAYAGCRPKLAGPGEPPADFRVDPPSGASPRSCFLYGIESPGLTAALPLAELVGKLLGSPPDPLAGELGLCDFDLLAA